MVCKIKAVVCVPTDNGTAKIVVVCGDTDNGTARHTHGENCYRLVDKIHEFYLVCGNTNNGNVQTKQNEKGSTFDHAIWLWLLMLLRNVLQKQEHAFLSLLMQVKKGIINCSTERYLAVRLSYGTRARRKPLLLLRLVGVLLLRLATRQFCALLFHDPPRKTRFVPTFIILDLYQIEIGFRIFDFTLIMYCAAHKVQPLW